MNNAPSKIPLVKAGTVLNLGDDKIVQARSNAFDFHDNEVTANKTGLLTIFKPPKETNQQHLKSKQLIEIVPLNGTLYFPQVDDIVIGVITKKNFESYSLDIKASAPATLGVLEYEGATRKGKPNLVVGALVFCRVIRAEKYAKVELSCISPFHKKQWTTGEAFFGPLQGGCTKDVSLRLARLLLMNENYIFSKLEQFFEFQMTIGYNGKVWLQAKKPKDLIFLLSAFEKIDEAVQEAKVDFAMEAIKEATDKIMAALKA